NLVLTDRERLVVNGVEDVKSFNDECVILYTNMGILTVKGSELHINRLNVESGESIVEGIINSCEFQDGNVSRESMFSRLFR
ncbi:MAG: sporulation protein YabP, partial [Oscillospiraceae bacterium]|nr:sporulation protein YabP [Oscillospiraceae bacterium]